MYLLEKLLVPRLLILLVLTSVSIEANANLERQYVELISHDNKPYMVASIFQNEQVIERPLLKFEDGLKGADDSKQSALFKQYYSLMIKGEPKNAASLFFEQDGSKERYINSLLSMPTKYAGYTNLERIDFLTSFGWGPFQIVEVKLSGAQNRSMMWREALICDANKCFISNKIDNAESNVNKISQVRRLLDNNAKVQAKNKDAFDALDTKAIFLPTDAMQYSSIQNVQYPMVFSFAMQSITPITLDLSRGAKTTASINDIPLSSLQSVYQELAELASLVLDENLKNQKDSDPEKSAAIAAYNEVIDQYLGTSNSRNIYLYSLFETKENAKLEFKREWYHPIAAIQRISRWQNIKIYGYIPKGETQMVVFFQPSSKDALGNIVTEPMQAIAIESSAKGTKLMLTDFTNNASQTINFAMEAPVVEVLGEKYADTPTFIYKL